MEPKKLSEDSFPDSLKMNTVLQVCHAAAEGNVKALEALMKEHSDLVNKYCLLPSDRTQHGYAPLHEAIAHGHIEAVKLLLRHGADPNLPTFPNGLSPLSIIISSRSANPDAAAALFRVMLEGGANGTAPIYEASRLTPVLFARNQGYKDLADLLDEVLKSDTAQKTKKVQAEKRAKEELRIAQATQQLFDGTSSMSRNLAHDSSGSKTDKVDILFAALANNARVNAVDESGWSPLHWAAKNGHEFIVQVLLAAGADPRMKEQKAVFARATPYSVAKNEAIRSLLQVQLLS